MISFKPDQILAARLVKEDKDTVTLEINKHNKLTMSTDPEHPDTFYTILFVRRIPGVKIGNSSPTDIEAWKPWLVS